MKRQRSRDFRNLHLRFEQSRRHFAMQRFSPV
jgi:hypothetical protein